MSNIKIGWIGLGNMGIPMTEQLLKAEYSVTVYNRSKGKDASLTAIGATVSESPKALSTKADVIIIMVTDDQAITSIFEDENGLIHGEIEGKIIVNMSTVSPSISKKIAAICTSHNCRYLDAPVSGSVKQAETGQLVIMVGGAQSVFEEVKPILDQLGKLSKWVGETGAGNTAKLAINSLLALYTQGLAETILFANDKGINPADLLELIGQAAIGNVYTKIKGEAILNDQYKAAFALKHIVKDLRLAKDEGISTPLAKAALKTFEDAESAYGEEDLVAIFKALR
ncbi:3-hydroxyisobutyrate dehydrogenase [Pedobacter psychrotolerans]|uniref:3-hydroxy acid dehydrogenase n=1 Tax=Pedobacter psychrotolerans TaxID=1843235 RepID=A0A4R2HL01_9SPHI|nr:NAD(P)-dependent oxidoreductase [Pedobacter psychrotolerans]TCO30720.1 3-hydroxyisobutyrate dehydrogenase [Pedobacter psychrotolerans]GGE44928.1 3-hydroxy acid dehydrogenase [Pedobacter psychrotolerans]